MYLFMQHIIIPSERNINKTSQEFTNNMPWPALTVLIPCRVIFSILGVTANTILGKGRRHYIRDLFPLDHNYYSRSSIKNSFSFKLFSYLCLSDEVLSVDVILVFSISCIYFIQIIHDYHVKRLIM